MPKRVKSRRGKTFHRRKLSRVPLKIEKPFYLAMAALAVLVVVGGIFISPYAGGPTGAQTGGTGIIGVVVFWDKDLNSQQNPPPGADILIGDSTATCSNTFEKIDVTVTYTGPQSGSKKLVDCFYWGGWGAGTPKANINYLSAGTYTISISGKGIWKRMYPSVSSSLQETVTLATSSSSTLVIFGVAVDKTPPGQATNLQLQSKTKNSVKLIWQSGGDADSGHKGDKVYYTTAANPNAMDWILYPGLQDSFNTLSGFQAGTAYKFMVSTVDVANNEGQNSSSLSVTTDPATIPSEPQNLVATTKTGPLRADLSWSIPADDGGAPISNAGYYNIYRKDSLAGIATKIGSSCTQPCLPGANENSYTDTTIQKGKTYYYTAKAVNGANLEGQASNEVSATTPDVPAQTTGLAATGGIGKVDLSWTAPASNGGSTITCYKVYRSTTQTGTFTLLTGTETAGDCANSPVGTTYTDNSVSAGTTYYYKTAAMNAVGLGVQSSFASANVLNVPAAITTLTATAGTKKIDLAWTAPNNGGSAILCYKVFRWWLEGPSAAYILISSSNPDNFNSCEPSDPTATSYTDTAVSEKQTYKYIVEALNAVGLAPASNAPQAKVPDTTAPTVLLASLTNNTENLRTDLPSIMLNFSEPISASTITASTIAISPAIQHTRALEPSGKDLRITLSENLSYAKTYVLTAGIGIKDLENNALASDYKLWFTTVTDATTLIVLETDMQNNSVNISAALPEVSITFNKEISADTDTAITISPSVNFAKQWSADKKTVNLSFSSLLAYDTNYKLTTAKTLKDIYGFSPPSSYTIVFSTEPATMVEAASIENNTADAAVGIGNLTLTFNRAINASTDSAITIFPKADIKKQWSEDGKTVIISFAKNLDYKTDYKLTISASLKDYLGINLAAPYRLSFKTVLPATTTTQPSSTTTSTVSIAIGTTTTIPRGTTTTFAPAGEAEALAAIKEANQTIIAAQGIKNVSTALNYYSQAIVSYNNADYPAAKAYALQAKDSIKEKQDMEQIPVLYISFAAIVLLIAIAGLVYFMHVKKLKAGSAKTEPQEPTPPAQQPEQPSTSAFKRKNF